MLTRVITRLTYANVMATLAFFFALGGTAVAGATVLITGADIRDGSITGRDVHNRSLSGSDLGRESVTGKVIRNGSVTLADFRQSDRQRLRGPKGDVGPQGSQGPKGDPGATGPKGDPGSSDIIRVASTAPNVTGYVNQTPLISQQVPADGAWLMLVRMEVTNTGANDANFSCVLRTSRGDIGGGGDSIQAGTTKEIFGIAFSPLAPGDPVVLACDGGTEGPFNLANIRLSAARLF
jgi:hypothetical protein